MGRGLHWETQSRGGAQERAGEIPAGWWEAVVLIQKVSGRLFLSTNGVFRGQFSRTLPGWPQILSFIPLSQDGGPVKVDHSYNWDLVQIRVNVSLY